MKIAVAGGAGFIGSHFVKEKLNDPSNKDEIIVIDKLTYAGDKKNFSDKQLKDINFHNIDICDYESVIKVLKNCDAVINFAAESHVDNSLISPELFLRTNVQGVLNLLMATRYSDINRFIQISTDEVYGVLSEGQSRETDMLNPTNIYSGTKASADLMAKAFCETYDIDLRITRSSNNYGTFQFPEKFIPKACISLLNGNPIPIYGDGLNVRNWINVKDNVRAIDMILTKGKPNQIYNISGSNEITNLELANMLVGIAGYGSDKIYHIEDRKGHDFKYSIDDSKLRNELGFEIENRFSSDLQEIYNWYRENKSWWSKKVNH